MVLLTYKNNLGQTLTETRVDLTVQELKQQFQEGTIHYPPHSAYVYITDIDNLKNSTTIYMKDLPNPKEGYAGPHRSPRDGFYI